MATAKFKPPKDLGTCADMLYDLRAQRAEAQRVVDAIEAQEKQLKEHIIDTLPKSNLEGVSGHVANIRVNRKIVPTVKDWDKLYAYVHKNKAWHLLQRRVADAAVKELWEAKKKVPGVEEFQAITVSCTKL